MQCFLCAWCLAWVFLSLASFFARCSDCAERKGYKVMSTPTCVGADLGSLRHLCYRLSCGAPQIWNRILLGSNWGGIVNVTGVKRSWIMGNPKKTTVWPPSSRSRKYLWHFPSMHCEKHHIPPVHCHPHSMEDLRSLRIRHSLPVLGEGGGLGWRGGGTSRSAQEASLFCKWEKF